MTLGLKKSGLKLFQPVDGNLAQSMHAVIKSTHHFNNSIRIFITSAQFLEHNHKTFS